jgi:Carboxypeptidase regulatory-like domain
MLFMSHGPFLGVLPAGLAVFLLLGFATPRTFAAPAHLAGHILDPQGKPVPNAHLKLITATNIVVSETESDAQGEFQFNDIGPGVFRVTAEAPLFTRVTSEISLSDGQQSVVSLRFNLLAPVTQSVSVFATSTSALTPDASERVVVHDQTLDANPGRPGVPLSIPGLPVETASGGIKAPQYFAPGVAGDHGEPIAQFFQLGNFIYPNNLPANAHGNGYSDPNFLISPIIEGVSVDGGAFNVREGNHSVDLAATYLPRTRINSFITVTGDYRDIDLAAAWAPRNPNTNAWIAVEASYGNGYLERLEHRQQYKFNAYREFKFGRHDLSFFGAAYYGFSFVPGLIPINTPVPNDTIDNRQLDRTHNLIAIASDTWSISDTRQLAFSGFFREYALQLRSNFSPDFTQQPLVGGLIQQSESRIVIGGGPLYTQRIRSWINLLAGVDVRRDAPQNLDLRAADDVGSFHLVTSNNLTLSFVEPYASLDGALTKYFHYDVGFRREEVWIKNEDNLNPQNSFDKLAGVTLPKGTLTILPPESILLPSVAFSYGEGFHTEDPRIGTGSAAPTLIATSRAYQLILDKTVKKTELRITLKHVANSQELAKIDADTGLQENEGPSIIRVISVSLQRTFSQGSIFISYAQADARDRITGEPVPEAPRFIWDAVATVNRLPFHLRARCEFEYVGAKPLGDGFVGVPVPEFRGAMLRPFLDGRMTLSTEFLIAHGYTGQTTEVFALPSDATFPGPIERVVGVPLKSYVTFTWAYHFDRLP